MKRRFLDKWLKATKEHTAYGNYAKNRYASLVKVPMLQSSYEEYVKQLQEMLTKIHCDLYDSVKVPTELTRQAKLFQPLQPLSIQEGLVCYNEQMIAPINGYIKLDVVPIFDKCFLL